ncbi:UDP-glucose dehydrogenase family protein [Fimbriimonas ginsengisoli]|uniref:UDP-glucose dehydrogenase family protein n=1 Tax=Fimbriimonas ginsengisoli TaxID=1005039 RepID=UPI00046C946C|nr:UDP-glucose/GDP-mannose dehydrogenase family protein [Fimbriimonas ginsengisoli]
MKIVIYGTGYVGLTTGAAMAFLGHEVTCVDIDEAKIASLRGGKSPIYEPRLDELMELAGGNLRFSVDPAPALSEAEVVFVAVGTPPMADGNPDLTAVQSAASSIGRHLGLGFTVVVNKSTVPIGSGHWVESLIAEASGEGDIRNLRNRCCVASNPEFLREGSALCDILYPDRVVVGSENPTANEVLARLYEPILQQSFTAPWFLPRPEGMGAVPLVATDLASAELIKYASNAFLCTKISLINEIGNLAEKVGADITHIARGMGLDARIGGRFLQAGLGWGGSCFGKDSAALIATAKEYDIRMPIVEAAREVNYAQRDLVVTKLLNELKILKGRTVGILGLAFKPNTDDIRDAPALDIAQRLIDRGARIQAHDPIALDRASCQLNHSGIRFGPTAEAVAAGADALVLTTDWAMYRDLPWKRMAKTMANPLILDGRNFLDQAQLVNAGFRFLSIGR